MKINLVISKEAILIKDIAKARSGIGQVSFFYAEHDGTPEFPLVNKFMEEIGFGSKEDWWKQPSAHDAHHILKKTILFDMAYSLPVANPEEATEILNLFWGLFKPTSDPIRFFSNYAWNAEKMAVEASGFLISGATFNVGVVAANSKQIAMLLIEDED